MRSVSALVWPLVHLLQLSPVQDLTLDQTSVFSSPALKSYHTYLGPCFPLTTRPFPPSLKWTCQFCTFLNTKPGAVCEMCNLQCKDSGDSLPQSLQQPPSCPRSRPQLVVKPQPKPRLNVDLKRQNTMKKDGLSLIQQIRVGHSLKEMFSE